MKWIPAVLAAIAAGFVLAAVIPDSSPEPQGPVPTLVATSLIPPAGDTTTKTFTVVTNGTTITCVRRFSSGQCQTVIPVP